MTTLNLKPLFCLASALMIAGCGTEVVDVKFDIDADKIQKMDEGLQGRSLVIKKIYFTDAELQEIAGFKQDYNQFQDWVGGDLDVSLLDGNVFEVVLAKELTDVKARYDEAQSDWVIRMAEINAERAVEIAKLDAIKQKAERKLAKYDDFIQPAQVAYSDAELKLVSHEGSYDQSWSALKSIVELFVRDKDITLSRSERRRMVYSFDQRVVNAGLCEQVYVEFYVKTLSTRPIKHCRGVKVVRPIREHPDYPELIALVAETAESLYLHKDQLRDAEETVTALKRELRSVKLEASGKFGNRSRHLSAIASAKKSVGFVMDKYDGQVSFGAKERFISDALNGVRLYLSSRADAYASTVNVEMLAKKEVEQEELNSFSGSFSVDANKGSVLIVLSGVNGTDTEFSRMVDLSAGGETSRLLDLRGFKRRVFVTFA
ncbi:hypothetical protein [Vibrio owensii]|uniref:hypothetical protein n=1 Tax=Vibrio owensii TaxID=696485 RepID=UPI0018F16EE4|nr:hypothetical protein [Vibrio owensii]